MFGKKDGRSGKNYARTATGRKINMTQTGNPRPKQGIQIQMGRGYNRPKSKYFMDRILDPLEKKYGRYALHDLMLYMIGGMGLVYLFDLFTNANPNLDFSLISMFTFDRALILKGQVWRIFTFIFIPESRNMLLVFIELYMCWMIGTSLEKQLGSFRFNSYYLIGVLFCIAAGFITGRSTNIYLNLSLFLAYALFFPNQEFLVFFLLPVKVKWLALLDVLLLLGLFVTNNSAVRIVLLFSMANLLLFFGRDIRTEAKYLVKKLKKK